MQNPKPRKSTRVLFVVVLAGLGLFALAAALDATLEPRIQGVVQTAQVDSAISGVPIVYTILLSGGQHITINYNCTFGRYDAACTSEDILYPPGTHVTVRQSYNGPYEFPSEVGTVVEYCWAVLLLGLAGIVTAALLRKNHSPSP